MKELNGDNYVEIRLFYGTSRITVKEQGGNSIDFKTSQKSSRKSNLKRRYVYTTDFFKFLALFLVIFLQGSFVKEVMF